MVANLVGHWLIGLPFAAFVAFAGLGRGGLWVGLSLRLTLVAIVLMWCGEAPAPAGGRARLAAAGRTDEDAMSVRDGCSRRASS